MLKEFREILTKSGRKMAFGALEDPAGSIEIVVFADALERWKEKFVVDSVLCLRGKIDLSRGKPSLKVEEFVDPASLRERSWNAVHLRLGIPPSHEEDLYALRDALFDEHRDPAACIFTFRPEPTRLRSRRDRGCVATTADVVVKAHVQITCSSSEEALERLRSVSPVVEAWRD